MNIRRIGCAILLAAALLSPALPAKAQSMTGSLSSKAQPSGNKTAKLVSLMKQCGFNYVTTNSPTVFVIHSAGTHLKDIKTILALGDDEDSDLVVFVTVAEKRRLPATADFRYTLLKMNHEFDMVKVGFDHDDDLSVRIDASSRLADATYLKNVVGQIQRASDEIYGKIQPSLQP
jgi:hypothetical protein